MNELAKTNEEPLKDGQVKCKPLVIVGFADAMKMDRPPLELVLLQSEDGKKFIGVSIGENRAGMPIDSFLEGLGIFLMEALDNIADGQNDGPTKEQLDYLEEVKKKLVR